MASVLHTLKCFLQSMRDLPDGHVCYIGLVNERQSSQGDQQGDFVLGIELHLYY